MRTLDGARSRFVTVTGSGGVPINVVDAGCRTGPAVLFVHGMTQSHLSWTAQLHDARLGEQLRMVAMDLRGHGASGKPWTNDAYDAPRPWAEDVLCVVRALGLEMPTLVGWSFGGHVLMDVVRVQGTRGIGGLVFVATHAGLLPVTVRRMAPLGGDLEALMAAAEAFMARMAKRALPAHVVAQGVASFLMLPDYARAAMAGRCLDNAGLLDEIDIPTTFIMGTEDPYVDDAAIAALAQRLRDGRSLFIDEVGHMPFAEDARAFNAALLSVVGASPTARGAPR